MGLVAGTPSAAGAAEDEVDFLSDEFYEDDSEFVSVNDPIEPFNRAMFTFNDRAYFWVLNPVATGYSYVLPDGVRGAIWKFFNNLEEPVRAVNCLLQARFSDAGLVLFRFVVNSTCGMFGLGDPAGREMGVTSIEATLGETMATWGIGDGFYLVMPLFGSTTLRDFTGTVIDGLALTPYYMWTDDWGVKTGIYAGKETNKLSLHLGEYEDLIELSFDPYVSLRNGYFQYRKRLRDHSEFNR
ncbi:MAG: VacJ family lipoprotein [Desulfobulbaceae bacterium]|nr:VacJ family lipoprotein [Desulfobulbaceae bacterium]